MNTHQTTLDHCRLCGATARQAIERGAMLHWQPNRLTFECRPHCAKLPPAMDPADTASRRAFEHWYVTHAFAYEKNPIGSRDCALQWAAWQAALTFAQRGEAPE